MRPRTTLSLVLFGGACVVHEDYAYTHETVSTVTSSAPSEAIDCALPPYDLPSLDCTQLGNAFESTMRAASACNGPQDCQLVRPRCETWGEVSCYYAANYCVDSQQLDTFDAEASGCTAGSVSCDCDDPPAVDCVNRQCVLISPY